MVFRPYQLTSFVIGVMIAGVILYLVRRDRVHIRHTFWWMIVAASSLVLGAFPRIIDWVARIFKVGYAPILLVTVGLGMALIKILTMDIEISDLERKMRQLSQRLAILDGEDKPRVASRKVTHPGQDDQAVSTPEKGRGIDVGESD